MDLVIFLNYREIKRIVRIYTSIDLERYNLKKFSNSQNNYAGK